MSGADNQQETSLYYYTGFCVGELSCSVLKLSNKKSRKSGVYYSPDITITNADLSLLTEINQVIGNNLGVITPVKGAYNLSFRGKRKVRVVLQFFDRYPPIVGDLALSKLNILSLALVKLEGSKELKRSFSTTYKLEKYRKQLRNIKQNATPLKQYSQNNFDPVSIGYFLSGIWDAEGSVGMKKNGQKQQPFVAVAMKDQKIIHLFHEYFEKGHIHYRKGNVVHWECGAKRDVLHIIAIFTEVYPSKLSKILDRMQRVRRILNDYTPSSPNKSEMKI